MYEANLGQEDSAPAARQNTLEVYAYRATMNEVEKMMNSGKPLSPNLLCDSHKSLLRFTRGHEKSPGNFKTDQNYLADTVHERILFTPISPSHLHDGLQKLFSYIDNSNEHPLIKTAIAHVEFESLHPFNDGNGRIGRILITLMLWKFGLISRRISTLVDIWRNERKTTSAICGLFPPIETGLLGVSSFWKQYAAKRK